MSWDEKVFRWSLGAAQAFFSKKPALAPEVLCQVSLADIAPRLKVLASALAERAIEIKEAETVGGAIADTLFLPAFMSVAPDREWNTNAYLYRVVYTITLLDLGFVLPEDLREDPQSQLLMSLKVVPQVRAELKNRYPGLMSMEEELLAIEHRRRSALKGTVWDSMVLALLAGDSADKFLSLPELRRAHGTKSVHPGLIPSFWSLVLPASKGKRRGAQEGGEPPEGKRASLPSGTEKKGSAKETVEEVKLKEDKDGENPLVHSFEKVRTLDDYVGGRKMLDGTDELEEQLEALQELDLRKVIRTHERTDSLYKADVMLESGVGDLEESENDGPAQFAYDEWDAGLRTYKKDWCKVFVEDNVRKLAPEVVQKYVGDVRVRNGKQIRELRRQFEEFTYVRRWRTRQPDGPEIDIDAVVDRHAALKSGHSASRFLYLSQRPRERDFATLVLLDSSLSTDSWMKNRRVMDVMKESMLVLGEVISEYHDRLAIGAFYSNTRKDCRYVEVKKFDETWARCQAKLAGLHPTGYTRIGPALRHGIHLLSQVPARKKLLLLVSDGKPTDYDRYEGRYGIEDIRQAIREATQDNVTVRALAIEAEAKFYLPQMFGTGNFQILPDPSMLARSLAQIYGWLV